MGTFCSCEDTEHGDIATCQARIPPSLRKACMDDFDYALKLRDGTVLFFQSAALHGDWVHLTLSDNQESASQEHPLPYHCPRGIDVRLSEIIWCADAPWGS